MPKGFKVESEENMIKYVDAIKPPTKKHKLNVNFKKILYFSFMLIPYFFYYIFKFLSVKEFLKNKILFYSNVTLPKILKKKL